MVLKSNKDRSKKMKKKIVFLLVSMSAVVFLLTACGKKVVGTYKGSTGRTTLNIKKDQKVTYTQIDTNSGDNDISEGTWKQSGDEIIFDFTKDEDNPLDEKLKGQVDSNGVINIPEQDGWNAENFTKDNN